MKKSLIALTMAVILSAVVPTMAFAADLPKKVDVQLPASAGGGTDVAGRQLVQYINENYPTNLTIKNNTDGSGVVAFETVRSAKKDGSTILFFHTTMLL
ncbi:MAG: tripartite tricarboxylate transporter substrate binding protein, partial [Blautia sp.]|nr:tripartite tricarboxylate transporter substrate binding protein [Blautia sp.]